MKKPLTPLQRRLFFMVIRPAAQEVGADLEEYRKRILKEELGVEHMSDVGNTGDFDKLMSRIYQDCGDYARALEYSTGSVSRLAHLAVKAAERIVAAKPDAEHACPATVLKRSSKMTSSPLQRPCRGLLLCLRRGYRGHVSCNLHFNCFLNNLYFPRVSPGSARRFSQIGFGADRGARCSRGARFTQ